MNHDSTCAILKLPPELTQYTFSFLEKDELKTVRLVCSAFAKQGAWQLFYEIKIAYRKNDFDRLEAVSKRPLMAPCIRSFYFQPDILRPVDDIYDWLGSCGGRWEWEDASSDDPEMLAEFEAYKTICEEQSSIRCLEHDARCLSEFFRSCTNLTSIEIIWDGDVEFKHTDLPDSTHAKYDKDDLPSIYVHREEVAADERAKILELLGCAATELQGHVKHVKIHGVDILADFSVSQIAMNGLASPARTLGALDLRVTHFSGLPPAAGTKDQPTFDDFLQSASQSCERLQFSIEDRIPDVNRAALSTYMFSQIQWPNLRSLWVNDLVVDSTFFDFLQRLSKLEELSICKLRLVGTTYRSFFERLPKLRKATLISSLSSDEEDLRLDFAGRDYLHDLREALETFLVKGGRCPDIRAILLRGAAFLR